MSAREVSRSYLSIGQESAALSYNSKPHLPEPQPPQDQSDLDFQAEEISSDTIPFFDDQQWMIMVTGLLGMASNICSLLHESKVNEFVPYFSIVSGPLYLNHAIQEAKQRFKLMASACKTARVSEAFFWTIGAVGSVGTAVGNILRPVAGGVALFGLTSLPWLNTAFTFVIPIVLIAFSSIGGVNQAWALGKTKHALHELKKERKGLVSLKAIEVMVERLHGPQTPISDEDLAKHHYALDFQLFEDTHFTTSERREAVQKRIEAFFNRGDHSTEQTARAALAQILPLIQKTQDDIVSPHVSDLEEIESTLSDCNQAIGIAGDLHVDAGDLIKARDALLQLKEELLQEGNEIIDTVHSDIHRKVLQQKVNILAALIMIAAGILFLVTSANQQYIAHILSLSASALAVINVIFDKAVSQENYLQIERELNLLEIKPA